MDKQISKLKFYAFVFGLILLIQIIGLAFFLRNSNTLHSASLQKINSLISEVGTLKNENLLLNQSLENEKKSSQLNEKTLRQLYLNSTTSILTGGNPQKDLDQYKNFLEEENQKITNEKLELEKQLSKQNTAIKLLNRDNSIIKSFKDLNEKTFSILFLGENQKLTDTILLVIINTEKQKTTLLSIPRDLYYEGRKINEYYKFYGIEKTNEIIEKISGIKVDKYIRFNFDSFIELIDSIGGIDILIDKKIIDTSYPKGESEYQTVIFTPGLERMNGERALEFARSRKSTSDFDRNLRQQKIIIAIKSKLNSLGILENIEFYINIFQKIQKNLDTNLNVLEALQLFDQYKNYPISTGNILNNENFLYTSKNINGQSILLPKNNSFLPFQQKLIEIL